MFDTQTQISVMTDVPELQLTYGTCPMAAETALWMEEIL